MKRIRYGDMDDEGALEGLPLYMIILVVIAGIGTAVIGGWMMSAQTTELGSLEVEDSNNNKVDQMDLSEFGTKTIYITAYDQSGDPLEGVTISVEGCGASNIDEPVKLTDEDGEVSFSFESSELHVSGNSGTIDITGEYTGDMTLSESEDILVTE
ncbi:MAG: hypothetical protein KGY68_03010 [Candidatus Thermoplasmatota archaeon]|nr:hypothetical protein [Candidatus Thermoplasmatota archaeon]